MYGMKSEDTSLSFHVTFSTGLLAFLTACVIALLAAGIASGEGFGLILDVTGGVAGSLSAFLIPSAIYMKVMPKSSSLYTTAQLNLVFGIVIIFVVLVGTGLTLA
jgi:hypothetical protein